MRADETKKRRDVFDVIAVFVLSITAVLTAWCGFEASKWGGDMSIAFSEASGARIQAGVADGTARDARQYDLTIWTEWVLADRAQDAALTAFIEERFSLEFAVAFEAWDAGGRTERGPFVMPEYVPPGTEEAEELSERAETRFADALESNQRGDNYTLLTVLFALVLFLTAMSQRDLTRWVRWTLLVLAIAVGLTGAIIMLTFPILI
ncbi:hypothetical protein [Microbacterium sp. CIAB417]|uniref:hypothetical protein n=1 Tax=Microbacterium sp. CIAB417 TaxID=2860287 RepID=UPI001FAD4814|nr:hypothetical protein [Microbacterium sp. CIAB417]